MHETDLCLQTYQCPPQLSSVLSLGQLVGRLLASGGSTRPVIRLRPVSRLLMKSGQWVGRLLSGGRSASQLRQKEGLSVVYSTSWSRFRLRDDHWLENQLWLGERLCQKHSLQSAKLFRPFLIQLLQLTACRRFCNLDW